MNRFRSWLAFLVLWAALGVQAPAASLAREEPATPQTSPAQTAPAEAPPAPPPRSSPSGVPSLPPPGDEEIRAEIERALSADTAIAGHSSLSVQCDEGIVALKGKADTLSVLRQAEHRAGAVRGVLDVVTTAGIATSGVPDSRILLDIQSSLAVPAFRGDAISVAVDEAHVRLSGTTVTYARKLLAERSASEVPGVASIQNNIRVVAAAEGDDAELQRRSRLLLHGGLTPVPGNYEVVVDNRRATLSGRVPLFTYRIQAERLVLSVGGIVEVINKLKVDPSLTLPGSTVEVTP
jgi:osmotically-inducible protein OsmY